jgi:hypothetical protein
MPIRMTDDPNDPNQNDYNDDKGGGGKQPGFPGGGGGLGALLPLLLTLFKGKGIIVLLLLGGAAYFLLGKGNCNIADVVSQFSQSGYNFNAGEFDKAKIYEGLDENSPENAAALPEAISLLKFAPVRGDQGQQGSCVAWSSAYGARTVLEAAATGADPNQVKFSPSFMYNQIGLDDCQGSYIQRAMEQMSSQGALPLDQFPYSDQDCTRQPDQNQKRQAGEYKIHGFTRLTNGDNINSINVRAVKEHLAKDAPVVIGMMVGQSFMGDMQGKELWQPEGMDASQVGMGGHAMCVIGYDDRKFGGAFQIMNSWGSQWGDNGIGWVRYGDFKEYVKEAYGIDPLPKRGTVADIPLECTIGLVNNADKQYIRLRAVGGNSFQTISPITAGTRFKMEVNNVTECYIYIFGRETDGSSYVLFPYLKPGQSVSKHSPYCGITGYRLFPKNESMEADSIGKRDYIAIVASTEDLDYNRLNQSISNSSQADYAGKVNDALQSLQPGSAQLRSTDKGTIYFKNNTNDNKVVATIVAFDKQ